MSAAAPRPVHTRALARVVACAIALAALLAAAPARAATYYPLNIISYDTWRASSSMSQADIQAFLDAQTGPLGSLIAKEHDIEGVATPVKKPASQLIWEASQAWNINPKVILATLQKEQSLLTVSNADNSSRLRKAMGYGIYKGSPDRHEGFGNQIFDAARGFSTSGGILTWTPGKTYPVQVSATGEHITITPLNACTYRLYTYTPYYPQISFWRIYTTFFEDPLAPARLQPLYRFRHRGNGTYYYTASEAKRYTLIRTASDKWAFQGVSFSVDTSAAANTVPLYQMYNTLKHKFYYTTSSKKRDSLLSVRPRQWRSDGPACYVTRETSGTAPVYRLEKKTTGAFLLTSSASKKASLTTGRSAPFIYRGVLFRLDSLETTTPVGPTP